MSHIYYLQLVTDDNSLWIYDQTDEDECNWMIFVRAAKNKDEQNLVAYQSEGKIYFVSTKVSHFEMHLNRLLSIESDYYKKSDLGL